MDFKSLGSYKSKFVPLILSLPTGLLWRSFFSKKKTTILETCAAKKVRGLTMEPEVLRFKSVREAYYLVLMKSLIKKRWLFYQHFNHVS